MSLTLSRAGRFVAATPRNPDLLPIMNDCLVPWDVATAFGSGVFTAELYARWTAGGAGSPVSGRMLPVLVLASLLAALVVRDRRLACAAAFRDIGRLVGASLQRGILAAAILLAVGFASRALDELSRLWVVLWLACALAGMLGGRLALAAAVRLLERHGLLRESVAIIGSGAPARRLRERLALGNEDIRLLGVFEDDGLCPPDAAVPADGTITELLERGRQRQIDTVIIARAPGEEAGTRALIEQLKSLSVQVALCPELASAGDLPPHAARLVNGFALAVVAERPLRAWGAFVKNGSDRLLAALLLLLLGPLMLAIGLAIRLDSPGPAIFRQQRAGWNNRHFTMLKFRTMRASDEVSSSAGPLQQTRRGDLRVTRIGRLLRRSSLDELPQLFNVLMGEMSLVGPRPHALTMRTEDRPNHEIVASYAARHRVKPGMTGLAQIRGCRGATETAEQLRRRVAYDIEYIENWSPLLDLKILLLTAVKLFAAENAF